MADTLLRRRSRGLLTACLAVEALIILPVVIVVQQSASSGVHQAVHVLDHAGIGTLLVHTVAVAAAVTPLCGILGVATAFMVERTDLPGRRIWALANVAPVTIPPFVTSYAWVSVSSAFNGFAGAVVVTTCTYYPLVFLMVSASLRGLDPALEESARSLGCSGRTVFRRVVLPQIRPALLGSLLLVALDALVEFDAFAALKFQTISTDVSSQYLTSFSMSSAAVLSLASILLCVFLVSGESWLRGGANYTRVSHGASRAPSRLALGRARAWATGLMVAIAVVSLGVPLGILAYWFSASSRAALSAAAAGTRYILPAAVTSIGLGASGAVVALLLALPLVYAVTRRRGKLASFLERGAYLSFALPDLVGAVALGWAAIHWAHPLYGSVLLLIIAYAVLFVPLAVVSMRATLGQIEPAMEDCARSLGTGGLSSLWRVTLPIARPGVAAAAVLVFVFVIGDLSTTQILLPAGMYTLGTQFWSNSSTVAFAAAAPYAAILIVLAMVATYVLMSRFGRLRGVR